MSWLKDDNENKKEGTADKLSSFSSATNNTVHPTKQAEYQYQPVQQQPLFRFSTPTMGEAFAVNQKAIRSGADANSMNSGFNSFVNSYDLYRSPTSNAYGWLNSNGFNTANGVPLGYGANGKYTNGGSLSSTGKTQNEQAAYWWGQYEEDAARTSKLRSEYDAFLEELTHEANSPMRTMNDADLIQYTMSKYKEVGKLSDSYASQVPLQLTESFDNPYDAAYAALFKAYGNNSTGSVYGDSAVYNSGGGNGWVKNEDAAARLDFTSGRYDPYVLGSTMKDASSYFGTYVFDDKWLEDNASVMNGTDATAIKNYQSVASAYEFTTKAKEELADMNAYIADCLASGVSPDEVKRFIDGIDNSSFPSLTKLAKSLSTGKLVDTTSAIDFDPVGMFDKYVADYNEQARKNNTAEYVDTMDASLGYTGTVKAPTVTAQNGQIIVDHGNADERFAWMNGLPSETTAFAAEINSAIKNGTATAQDAYAGTLGVMGNLAVGGDYFSALGTIDRYQQISDKLDSISPELVAAKEATDAALDSAVNAFKDTMPGIYSEVLASRGEAGVGDYIFNSFGDPDARPDGLPDELLAYVDSRRRMESIAHNFQLWQEDLDTMQNQYDEAVKLQDDLIFHYNLSEDLRTMTEIPSNGRTTIPELMEIAYFYGFNNLEDAQYAYNALKNAGAGEEVLAKIQKDVDKYTYKALSAKEDFAKYGTIDGFNAATREILVEYGDKAFNNGLTDLLMNSDSILTDEEKKTAAYIYYTSDKNIHAVNDYLNSIDRTYTDATQEEAAQMKALAEAKDEEGLSLFIATHFGNVYDRSKANSAYSLQTFGKESPIVASLISLATNAANSFMTPAQMIATALGADQKLMDKLFSANTMTQNLRAGASSQMDEVGKFFYDAGMSIADNAITMAMGYAGAGGKTGEALSKSVGRYSELLMGSQAASSAMQEALDKGYDGPVAVLLGLASGALESITEKMDIDRFFSDGGFIKKIVSSMTGEFSEEFASEVGNAIADSLADLFTDNGMSDTQAAYRSFREQGMSHNDAVWAVIKGKFNDAFMAGLSGSLSGIAFGTSGYVRGTIAENRYNREQQQYKRDMEERTSAFEAANGEIKSVFDAFREEYEAGLDEQAAVPETNRTLNALQQKINEKLGPSIENFREKRRNYNAARKNLNAVNAKPVSIVDSSTFDTSEAAESYMNSEYVAPAGETLNSVQERTNARDEVERTKEEMQTAREDMQKASDESGFRLPKSYDRRNIRTQQTIADDGSAFAREILALDEASVSGQKNASATLEAVLADGAAGMHPDSAKAAVNALARRYGDNAVRKVLPVLMDAKRTGADPVAVKRAIIMAALNPDSSTAAIIEASDSFTNPSKNLVSALAIDVKTVLVLQKVSTVKCSLCILHR